MGSVIVEARHDADYAAARALFSEYATLLGVDLGFQGFTAELQRLPTMYGRPGGVLLLARDDADFIGCIGVRRWSEDRCEMKRLYVRDGARGTGAGRALALAAIQHAQQLGYRHMLLDTLADMHAARKLYTTLGFRECEAYCHNPNPGTTFMLLDLDQQR